MIDILAGMLIGAGVTTLALLAIGNAMEKHEAKVALKRLKRENGC